MSDELRSGLSLRAVATGHTDIVSAMATSVLDGRPVFVTGADDRTLRVWDLDTAEPVGQPLRGHREPVWAVATAELNGRPIIVSGSMDKTVRIWDLISGEPIGVPLNGHVGSVWAIATIAVNGRQIAVTGARADPAMWIWDLALGRPLASAKMGPPRAMTTAQIDGRTVVLIALTGYQSAVVVWDPVTARPVGTLIQDPDGYSYPVTDVAATVVNGRVVAITGSEDAVVRVWDVSATRLVHELTGHTGLVTAVAPATLNGGRPAAVSAGLDGTVRIWDLATGRRSGPEFTLPAPGGPMKSTPDGRLIVAFGSQIAVLAQGAL